MSISVLHATPSGVNIGVCVARAQVHINMNDMFKQNGANNIMVKITPLPTVGLSWLVERSGLCSQMLWHRNVEVKFSFVEEIYRQNYHLGVGIFCFLAFWFCCCNPPKLRYH